MSDFTQKHYEQVAAVLNKNRKRAEKFWPHVSRVGVVDDIAWDLADMFEKDNHLFKRAAFFALVGRPVSTEETGREEQVNE